MRPVRLRCNPLSQLESVPDERLGDRGVKDDSPTRVLPLEVARLDHFLQKEVDEENLEQNDWDFCNNHSILKYLIIYNTSAAAVSHMGFWGFGVLGVGAWLSGWVGGLV